MKTPIAVLLALITVTTASASDAVWLLWSEYRDGTLTEPSHPIGIFETLQECERAIDRHGAALRAMALGEVDTIFQRVGGNAGSTTFTVSPQSGPVARWDLICLPDSVDPRGANQ